MRIPWIKRSLGSIFSKLLMVMIVTAFIVSILVILFVGRIFRELSGESFHKNAIQYAEYLITDLGNPPDYLRALEISRRASLYIQYIGSENSWSTSPVEIPLDRARMSTSGTYPHIRFGKYRKHHFIEFTRDGAKYFFELAGVERQESLFKKLTITLLISLVIVFIGGYAAVRWVLKPINDLADGVRRVGTGQLNFQVRINSRDELGELAAAFNDMTRLIREMLHAKERLLLDVSHELRSPITRMKVSLAMMPDSAITRSITEDVAEMEVMVTEILESARLKSPGNGLKLRKVDLCKLIPVVGKELSGRKPGIRVSDLPDEQWVLADEAKLKIVLKNIVGNALKYAGNTGQPVEISLTTLSPYVIIRIVDTGIGINKQDIPYVFEPFYRTDTSRSRHTGGYGLGLSICKTIVEAHGGKIEIDSDIEIGTTVRIYLKETAIGDPLEK
ncbi:MAG: HAMP domain-containing histidine kinase [Desulfobacteraceae bacterium]|nr:HAMP domain-containing histidine kinase [Desulfobacteraceae bacterium]